MLQLAHARKYLAMAMLAGVFTLNGCFQDGGQGPDKNELSVSALTWCRTDQNLTNTPRPGAALDIAASGSNVWAIGNTPNGNGYKIYRWNGSNGWVNHAGGAERISVADNTPWVVNSLGYLYVWNGSTFVYVSTPVYAGDVGVSTHGDVYIVGRSASSGGNVYRMNYARGQYGAMYAATHNLVTWSIVGTMNGSSIALDDEGNAFVVGPNYIIYGVDDGSNTWNTVDYMAGTDVAATGHKKLFVVSGNRPPNLPNDYAVYSHEDGGCWKVVREKNGQNNGPQLGAKRIALASSDNPWYVQNSTAIFQASP